jgi:alkaline phosphatase D
MFFILPILASLVTGTLANWASNLNYESPSAEHPSLGIDVRKVKKRSVEKRDNTNWDLNALNFTHGVASVR